MLPRARAASYAAVVSSHIRYQRCRTGVTNTCAAACQETVHMYLGATANAMAQKQALWSCTLIHKTTGGSC